MDRFGIQAAFTVLKPCCDSLIKNPTEISARKVAEVVEAISDKVIQDLLEYILFPFTVHLRNDQLGTNVKEELVRTVNVVLSRARITKLNYYKKIHSCLLIQTYDKSQPCQVISGHEELKEAVLSCIKTLVHACFTEVVEALYTKQEAQTIGQSILLSITIARLEKSRSLRLTAIETLMALCQVDDLADRSDIILQDQVADVIMLLLPGIANGLMEIATGSEVQGHKVTTMALRAWARVISLVMRDKEEEETAPLSLKELVQAHGDPGEPNPSSPFGPKDRSDLDRFLKEAVRSPQWFQAAATMLNILVRRLDSLRKHSHYKVRLELARCVNLILASCSRNMRPNVQLLIQYLISLSEDESLEVSDEANKGLTEIEERYKSRSSMRPLVDLLEENLYNLLTKLPRIIRTSNDNEQLSTLNEVSGYLKLLGDQGLARVLHSPTHLHKLFTSLVHILELDVSRVSVLRSANVKDLEEPGYLDGPDFWRQFRFIQSKSCENRLVSICGAIGKSGDVRLLADFLENFITEAPRFRKELILIQNWIMDVPPKDPNMSDVYEETVEFYLSEELWSQPIETSPDVPLRVAQSNVLQCCLLMEGLAVLVNNVDRDRKKLLSKIVYNVMERVGSSNSLISFVASRALDRISTVYGYATIGDLLQPITDYLSYTLLLRLRRVRQDPGVLDVVAAVMRYTTMDVLPCLRHLLRLIFNELRNEPGRKENARRYVKIFHTFAVCVRRISKHQEVSLDKDNRPDKDHRPDKGPGGDKDQVRSEIIIRELLDYYQAKRVDDEIDEEGPDLDDEEPNLDDGTCKGSNLDDGTCKASNLDDGTCKKSNLGDGSCKESNIGDGTCEESNLDNGTCKESNLGDGTCKGSNLDDGTCKEPNLGGGEPNLDAGTCKNSNLGDGTCKESIIGDGTSKEPNLDGGTCKGPNFEWKMSDKVQCLEIDSETNESRTVELDRDEIDKTDKSFATYEDEKPEVVPAYVKPIEEVARHCLNLIPSREVQTSLIAIDTLIECLLILSDWEDRLLPLVHSVWSPLVEKFRRMDKFHEENVILMNRSWQLLNVIARVSKDFIRSRTLKEVAGPVQKFLTESAKESHKKGSQSVYRFTQVYKLQKELLSSLGRIAVDLRFREEQLFDVLTLTERYLDKYQNPDLQNCCVQLYKDVADYNGDVVWVKCLSLWHSKVSRIPCDSTLRTSDLKLPDDARDSYSKNVRTILDYLQEKDLC